MEQRNCVIVRSCNSKHSHRGGDGEWIEFDHMTEEADVYITGPDHFFDGEEWRTSYSSTHELAEASLFTRSEAEAQLARVPEWSWKNRRIIEVELGA